MKSIKGLNKVLYNWSDLKLEGFVVAVQITLDFWFAFNLLGPEINEIADASQALKLW